MTTLFTHPKAPIFLKKIRKVFATTDFYQRLSNRRILFVCGGPVKARSRSLRNRFFKYAEQELPNFQLFLAEKAAEDWLDHNSPGYLELAKFEKLIASISDGIVIFPETPGAIAELGYFANADDSIKKKILVVNDTNKQSRSFINIGIINEITRNSIFGEKILVDYKSQSPQFENIKEILNFHLRNARRVRIKYDSFSKIKPAERFLIVNELINILIIPSFVDLLAALKHVFNDPEKDEVNFFLSILVSSGNIIRIEDEPFLRVSKNFESSIDFEGRDINSIKIISSEFLSKNHPKINAILKEASA